MGYEPGEFSRRGAMCRTLHTLAIVALAALAASSSRRIGLLAASEPPRAPSEPPVAARDKYALPSPIAEASMLLDRGRANEAAHLLALVGTETLAKEAQRFGLIDKDRCVVVAKCQFFVGAYSDCLDNAGAVRIGARHSPFGIHYYGALASERLQLWPIMVMFTDDPEQLARKLLALGDKLEERGMRQLELSFAVGLARMDRFDEARQRLEKLAASAKEQDEAAALRLCLAQLAEREKAVRAGEIKPYSAPAFWMEALDSPSWWVQTQAMREVAELRDPAVFDKLAARLKHPRPEVRAAAVAALGWRGDRRAVNTLRPLLKDANANVRDSARLALETLGEKSD